MAGISPTSIYLNEEDTLKLQQVQRELSRRAGIQQSTSAVMRRALHDLFLTVCHPETTNDVHECNAADQVAA